MKTLTVSYVQLKGMFARVFKKLIVD